MKAERTNKPCPIPNVSSEDFYSFPPKLRQLAIKIHESGEYKSIKEYCQIYNFNYHSIMNTATQLRKKGKDFHRLIGDVHREKLQRYRHEVYNALRKGAIEGSIKHIELYLKLIGDLKESEQSGKVTNNLNILMLPALPARPPEEQTVIESENVEIKPALGVSIDAITE